MLKLNDISFSYGKTKVLDGFSLEINRNDKICLFGESGCGKTTILRLICGLEKPLKGQIIKDNDLKISMVFQENRLLPFKTILENLLLIGADKEIALKNLHALGLKGFENSYPTELSGGMQRRASIARAISVDFDILILDEAFTGLDQNNINISSKLILDNLSEKALVMVTHSKEEANLLNTQIKMINKI